MSKTFEGFERRILYVAKNYAKRSAQALHASMTRVLKDVALAGTITPVERGTLAAQLATFWPDVPARPTLGKITEQMVAIRAQHQHLEKLRLAAHEATNGNGAPPAAPDPAFAAATGRIKAGISRTIYLRHEVYEWLLAQCPPNQLGSAELVKGIYAVYDRMTTPRLEPREVPELPSECDTPSVPLHPQSVDDLQLVDKLERGGVSQRLQSAIRAMREAAEVIERVLLEEPVAPAVRIRLHDDLTISAYQLEELISFDPLHDDE